MSQSLCQGCGCDLPKAQPQTIIILLSDGRLIYFSGFCADCMERPAKIQGCYGSAENKRGPLRSTGGKFFEGKK